MRNPILDLWPPANIASARIEPEGSTPFLSKYRGHPQFLRYPWGISLISVEGLVGKVVDIARALDRISCFVDAFSRVKKCVIQ